MNLFKPLPTLIVGALLGTFLGPKILMKVRG